MMDYPNHTLPNLVNLVYCNCKKNIYSLFMPKKQHLLNVFIVNVLSLFISFNQNVIIVIFQHRKYEICLHIM